MKEGSYYTEITQQLDNRWLAHNVMPVPDQLSSPGVARVATIPRPIAKHAGWRLALARAPLLSICVPTYHRPGLLARTLRSIGSLSPDVEVLVSDNSTANDLSGRVTCFGLRHQPPGQWRYYRNAPGGNVTENFAACVRRARGHYVLMLHDDDYLLPGGLARLVAELRAARGSREVLLFGIDVVNASRRLMRRQCPARRRWLAPGPALTQLLTNSSWVRMPGIVASRAAYATFPPDPAQGCSADVYQWARFFGRWGVQLVPTCVAAYTVHEGALTAGMFNKQNVDDLLRVFSLVQAQGLLPANVLRVAKARFFHQFLLAGAYRALRHRHFEAAQQVLHLLKLPELRELPLPVRWLPVRWVFSAITWVGTLRVVAVGFKRAQA
jgi:hypothetical protein